MKNPLADPYVLGISSGAYLGAVIAIVLGIGSVLGGNFVGILAFIGAFVVSLAVLTLANIGSRANTAEIVAVRYGVKCCMQCNCELYCIYDKR